MRRCEDCLNCIEDFDIDDYTGETLEFCKCGLTDELIDCSEAEYCKEYEAYP